MIRRPRRAERTDALERDDEHPNTPPPRSIDAAKAAHAPFPRVVRRRALVVGYRTDRACYAPDDPVRLHATVRNRLPLPLPLRLRTAAPVP